MRCLGCGIGAPNPTGRLWAYTCPNCMGITFAHDNGKLLIPASLIRQIVERHPNPPHIEYYLGRKGMPKDDPLFPIREDLIKQMRIIGITSATECEECQKKEEKKRAEMIEGMNF